MKQTGNKAAKGATVAGMGLFGFVYKTHNLAPVRSSRRNTQKPNGDHLPEALLNYKKYASRLFIAYTSNQPLRTYKQSFQVSVDGKRLDWATEYEPFMRQKVQEGVYTKEEYTLALEKQELSKYFPGVCHSSFKLIIHSICYRKSIGPEAFRLRTRRVTASKKDFK